MKLIVTSDAYRRSSTPSRALVERDPENRLLARQNRFRVDAENVRDTLLSVSGLLSPLIGGPSVKPYQPEGYWDYLNFPKRTYVADAGDKRHRRGLYTWWQRQYPHPAMLVFDAPSREECTARRPRSNTPLQALVLLNDPATVEAARSLAAMTLAEAGGGARAHRSGGSGGRATRRGAAPGIRRQSGCREGFSPRRRVPGPGERRRVGTGSLDGGRPRRARPPRGGSRSRSSRAAR